MEDVGKYYDDEIFRYTKVSYGSDIFVGSQMIRFKMVLDTSTNLFIVPSTKCDYCEDLTLYDPKESSSSRLADSNTYKIPHASLYDHWVSNTLTG